MNNSQKPFRLIGLISAFFFFVALGYFLSDLNLFVDNNGKNSSSDDVTQGMMILIENSSIDGLSNMVNELYKRGIHTILHTGPEFVENNCEEIKKLTEYNVSLAGGCGEELWLLSYEEQKKVMSDTKKRIEACTGKPLEFITSRYWGWDHNTVKIAQELGIKNIFARGLVENGAAVFQPEGYDVKILSISNIKSVPFKYGSVCDYSYWIRDGKPVEMLAELDDAIENHDKITPVTHTNIGGLKKDWLQMWKDFYDSRNVDWVSWEEFSEVDYKMPLNRIPINKNVPYTPEMSASRDEKYKQEESIDNPCRVGDLPETTSSQMDEKNDEPDLVMFHNDTGPMCLEAKDFFEKNGLEYKEVLTTDDDFSSQLGEYKSKCPQSEGVSSSYSYYPFIFLGEKAYSGFNEEIGKSILQFLEK